MLQKNMVCCVTALHRCGARKMQLRFEARTSAKKCLMLKMPLKLLVALQIRTPKNLKTKIHS